MEEPFGQVPDKPTDDVNVSSKKISTKTLIIAIVAALIIVIAIVVIIIIATGEEKGDGKDPNHKYTHEVIIDGKNLTFHSSHLIKKDKTYNSGEYTSTTMDETVFLVVDGATLTLGKNVKVKKTGERKKNETKPIELEDEPPKPPEGDDEYSFYGINSAIVVIGEGSKVIINGATITSDSFGANGVVAVDKGEVTMKGGSIKTTQDSSRGLHATYQGKITAENVNINTKGGSCASLATDRGEGTVIANKMTLTTEGAGSPLIYSTGDISVSNSKGTSKGAQICVVEGKNTAKIDFCEFSCSGKGNRGEVDNSAIMIYQSMSGDADEGEGKFEAKNSTLTVTPSDIDINVPLFFVTNTKATIDFESNTINFPSKLFINATATDEWGRPGENGADVYFNVKNQLLTGKAIADELSSVIIEHEHCPVIDFYTDGNVTLIGE